MVKLTSHYQYMHSETTFCVVEAGNIPFLNGNRVTPTRYCYFKGRQPFESAETRSPQEHLIWCQRQWESKTQSKGIQRWWERKRKDEEHETHMYGL